MPDPGPTRNPPRALYPPAVRDAGDLINVDVNEPASGPLAAENLVNRDFHAPRPDTAREGFFGRLKNEFFRHRGWPGSRPEFMFQLDAYLRDGLPARRYWEASFSAF